MSDNEDPKKPNSSRRRGRRGGRRRKKDTTADNTTAADDSTESAAPPNTTPQSNRERNKERPADDKRPASGGRPANGGRSQPSGGRSSNSGRPTNGGRPQSNSGRPGSGGRPANSERSQSGGGRNKRGRDRREEPTDPTPEYIEYISGELFDNSMAAQLIVVEANPEGEVNTQMMIQFRGKYPELYAEYITLCHESAFQPGDLKVWQARDGTHVALACTQKDKYLTLASVSQIDLMFKMLREYTHEHTLESITMPPVGAGLGLLNWPNSRRQLDRAFKGWIGKIYVVVKSEKVERTN